MKFKNILFILFILIGITACGKEAPETPNSNTNQSFAKGADISWVTEMEQRGIKFYDKEGNQTECFELMKKLGLNSIRLRVWVNPEAGWCNKNDLVSKAYRAKQLGMRIMIDFHYSDIWADPSKQTKPAAWKDLKFEDLKLALANHTKDILNALKEKDITPEWIQIGNETGNGMLWDDGKASVNMAQYAKLNNAGYEAAKSVFSNSKVIIHLQNGNDNSLFKWLFDGLKSHGAKWDVIGMSLYPTAANWQTMNINCIKNVKDMISRYGSEVMICEVGMPWDQASICNSFITDLMTKSKSIEKCLGIFYWEPQCYNGWNGYKLGAFDNNGKPTEALNAFN